MLKKRIEYDPHAATRMRGREFTMADVRWLLEGNGREPTWAPEGSEPRWLIVGYLPDLRRLNRRELAIVFVERPDHYYIVTVEWWDDLRRKL